MFQIKTYIALQKLQNCVIIQRELIIKETEALHAYRIGFTHPVYNKTMEFWPEFPEDMPNLLTTLETD